MTNGENLRERISSMSDKDLAYLIQHGCSAIGELVCKCNDELDCKDCIAGWLKEEVRSSETD